MTLRSPRWEVVLGLGSIYDVDQRELSVDPLLRDTLSLSVCVILVKDTSVKGVSRCVTGN